MNPLQKGSFVKQVPHYYKNEFVLTWHKVNNRSSFMLEIIYYSILG